MSILVLSKSLTKTDVDMKMSFPTRSLNYLLSLGVDGGGAGRRPVAFQAMDENGHVWRLGCTMRRRGHPKPVLSRGWLAFARHKNLQVGDRVEIYHESPYPIRPLQLRIEVRKPVKVFGVVFGYAPPRR